MILTILQQPKSSEKAFISWSSWSSNTHCTLNSPNLSLEDKMLVYKVKKKVKANYFDNSLDEGTFWSVEHLKSRREQECGQALNINWGMSQFF